SPLQRGGSDASRPVQTTPSFPPSLPQSFPRPRRTTPSPACGGGLGWGPPKPRWRGLAFPCRPPKKSPAEAGLFITRFQRSEPVLRRNTVQVGAAVERTDDAAAARGGVDPRVVRLQVAEGEVHVQRIADRPGRTDRVPAAIVVGQARGAVHEAGGGLVVGNAAAQGPAVVE